MEVGGPLHTPEKETLLNIEEDVELATEQFHRSAREKNPLPLSEIKQGHSSSLLITLS
jgi:hypothetical protein